VNSIETYLKGIKSISQICSELSVSDKTFTKWLSSYQSHGIDGLVVNGKNRYYPETIKLMAVQDYLAGRGSYVILCKKHNITDTHVLRRWVRKYNGHETFKSHNAQGDRFMATGRKTTYEEKMEIVSFCIANNDNYQLASDQFKVSYQQVYTWTKKYRDLGYEALIDRRGKRKNLEELSEAEKSAAQFKLLEAENKRLKMENDFLKKLGEVERRR
jgi:transposase-like protein